MKTSTFDFAYKKDLFQALCQTNKMSTQGG